MANFADEVGRATRTVIHGQNISGTKSAVHAVPFNRATADCWSNSAAELSPFSARKPDGPDDPTQKGRVYRQVVGFVGCIGDFYPEYTVESVREEV